MKAFVLLRGKSGLLYVYERELWEYMKDMKIQLALEILEFVTDHDDKETLEQMQALINKDLLRED